MDEEQLISAVHRIRLGGSAATAVDVHAALIVEGHHDLTLSQVKKAASKAMKRHGDVPKPQKPVATGGSPTAASGGIDDDVAGYDAGRAYWKTINVATPSADMVTGKVALEVQQPWADLLLNGEKTVETRTYPFPPWLWGDKIDVLQAAEGTPGVSAVPDSVYSGDPRFQLAGWIEVQKCFKYASREEWASDTDRHRVPIDEAGAYGWSDDRDLYGWVVSSTGRHEDTSVPNLTRVHRSFFVAPTDAEERRVEEEAAAKRAAPACDFASHGPFELLAQLMREKAPPTLESLSAPTLAAADAEGQKWGSISLVAMMSPHAKQQLITCGLCEELASLPQPVLQPLLTEMVKIRHASQQTEAIQLKPVERPARELVLPPSASEEEAVAVGDPEEDAPASDTPLLLVVVARYQEDVSWLSKLPPRVTYHILQKGSESKQPEYDEACQTILPNVGREAHSYLSFVSHCSELPPLIVFTQGNPFDHNASFLAEVSQLTARAALDEERLPPWTPLGLWSGGERIVYCDGSGAPHQPKLLPLAKTWRALFPSRPMPLWLGFTPGACFAVTREALKRRLPPPLVATALSEACGLCGSADPIAGHCFERLWMYLLLDDEQIGECSWA